LNSDVGVQVLVRTAISLTDALLLLLRKNS
jgi:hypothetical protein